MAVKNVKVSIIHTKIHTKFESNIKKSAWLCGFLTSWCRLAELNCQFSITIAAYCHYTKAAALIYNTKFAEEFNTQSANKFLTPQFPAFILSSRFTAKRQKTKAAASESQNAYQLYERPRVFNNRMKQGTSTIS